MLRHAYILGVIPRRLKAVYSLVSNQKLYLQSYFVPCATISSSKSKCGYNSSSRKMGDTQSQTAGMSESVSTDRPGKIKLSEEEWKKKLTPEEYNVTRQHGTEPAWTGALLENKDKGIYMCTCCGAELFSSNTKFDSGSGWPSFTKALSDKDTENLLAVDTIRDTSGGMVRVEVRCGKCDAHLGHVFNDGPSSTGLRYCINSVCLKFKPENPDKKGNQK